jgi:phospholipid/cholesterol/gamma-HCH transport system substrate-binding protein
MSVQLRRRIVVSLAVFVAAVCVGAALGAGGDGDGDGKYLVRATFDNASFIIAGEDVKVAGVVVGSIDSLDVDAQNRAVVVLRIDDPAFRPFHQDATCRIGLQSLIGEQFVECDPTQTRGAGKAPAPELTTIADGDPGAGQHPLPLARTSSPVGVDLLQNIMRVPQRQRLPLILNELGAGVSGNGEELNAAIKRASPVLQKADDLVKTLAGQDKMLGKLTDDSDAILASLADRRKDVGRFVKNAGDAGTATARHGDALEQNFAKLPAFLKQLSPATDRLGAFADQGTAAIDALASEAETVNASVKLLGPVAKQATPTFTSLGKVADQGRETFPRLLKTAQQLNKLGTSLQPVGENLAKLSTSLDETGSIESLMRLIYFYVGAINGEDASGHYTRTALGFNACVDRVKAPDPNTGCLAQFFAGDSSGDGADDASAARAKTSSSLLGYLMGEGQ